MTPWDLRIAIGKDENGDMARQTMEGKVGLVSRIEIHS